MRPSSPKKSSPGRRNQHSPSKSNIQDDYLNGLQGENQNLQFQIGERDVEIERMKTTLMALNEKLQVLTDIKQDIDDHKEYIKNSEDKRNDLQSYIENTGEKIVVDTKNHSDQHQEHIDEIDRLRNEIQQLKLHQAQREQDHLNEQDANNQKHHQEIQQKVQNIDDIQRKNAGGSQQKDQENERFVKNLQNENAALLQKTNKDHLAEVRQMDEDKSRREREHLQTMKTARDKFDAEMKRAQDKAQNERDHFDAEVQRSNQAHQKELSTQSQNMQNERDHFDAEKQDIASKNKADQEHNQFKNKAEVNRLNDQFQKERDHFDAEMKRTLDNHRQALDKSDAEMKAVLDNNHRDMLSFRMEQEQKDQANRKNLEDTQRENSQKLANLQSQNGNAAQDMERKHTQEKQQAIKEFTAMESQLQNEKEQLRAQKDQDIQQLEDDMDDQRQKFEKAINQLKNIKESQENTILEKSGTIMSLEETLRKKLDVEDQLAEALQREQDNQAARDNLQKELDHATDYILELEEKVYKANKTSLELLKQLKDAEVEIETLKQYIIDLKQRIAVYIPVKEDAIDKKLAEFINNYPERSKLKIMFMRESEGVYQFGTKRVAVKVEKDAIKIRVGGGYLSIDEFLDQYTPVELEKLERKDPLKRFSEKVAIQKTIVNAGVRESSPVQRSPGRQSPGRKTAV